MGVQLLTPGGPVSLHSDHEEAAGRPAICQSYIRAGTEEAPRSVVFVICSVSAVDDDAALPEDNHMAGFMGLN